MLITMTAALWMSSAIAVNSLDRHVTRHQFGNRQEYSCQETSRTKSGNDNRQDEGGPRLVEETDREGVGTEQRV